VSTNAEIQILVNGEPCAAPAGETIGHLLARLELDPARVAVELDRRIVKPHDWAATQIADGARLEIVQFVGGG